MSVFETIANRVCYTFAVAAFSIIGAWFAAAYAGLFLLGSLPKFNYENFRIEILAFLLSIAFATLGHYVSFGLLTPLGVPALSRELRRINKFYHPSHELDPTATSSALTLLASLPTRNMLHSFAWASICLAIVITVNWLSKSDIHHTITIITAWVVAAVVYAGFSYILTDYLAGPLRHRLRKNLTEHADSYPAGLLSLQAKFGFLQLLIVLITLGLTIYLLKPGQPLATLIAFITLTIISTQTLSFLFLRSIRTTLSQIGSAALNLAEGGTGDLHLNASESEFMQFARNFHRAAREVREIRGNLEQLIMLKTRELSAQLEETTRMRVQQDGDYYLTSLLAKPLSKNLAKSETLTIEFFTAQKKTFSFGKHYGDIGGDLNCSFDLYLSGEKYTFIVNADAMGKSMQGAGGALVFGAALRTIREDTSRNAADIFPEHWLRELTIELNKIFQSFEGSMMVSMCAVLIHDRTGFMLYVNAEHPAPILLRKETASFLKSESELRKLGSYSEDTEVILSCQQLQPNDVIILGSDGKDDIRIKSNGDLDSDIGSVDSDEERILRIVEGSLGEIDSIVASIKSFGEIVDDLSLVHVRYNGSIRKNNTSGGNFSDQRRATIANYKKRKYLATAATAARLSLEQPSDEILTLLAADSHLKTGNPELARRHIERLLLRKSENAQAHILHERILGKLRGGP